MIRTAIAVFLLCNVFSFAAETIDVKSTGAKGDGTTLDTEAIQSAIDKCSAAGGGTVNVPEGTFVIGTILIKDNVKLHLADKAVLFGTGDLALYKNVDPFKDGLGAEVGFAMVAAVDAKNIAIEGKGTINGNRVAVVAAKSFKGEGWGFRPFLLRLVRCENATVRDVALRDSASWTFNLAQCKNINIEGITLNSRGAPHNDGIDIDSSERVNIKGCDIVSGDDAICLKSTSGAVCRDVTVSGCRLSSNQGAIKMGTESYGGFENVNISNCTIYDTKHGGIKVLGVDGGHVRNVTISDMTMENVSIPIFMRLGARLKTFREGDEKKEPGTMQNITIRNITAKLAAKSQLTPPMGMLITGIPDHRIENLTIENVVMEIPGGGTQADATTQPAENITTYPEVERFGKVIPAYGAYVRHVKNLKMSNVVVKLASPDLRPAIVCDDVQNATISGWKLPDDAVGTFLRVEGKDSTAIRVSSDNQIGKAVIDITKEATSDAVVK